MITTRTSTMNTLERWQDEYLDLMARWEEPVVKFTGKAADSVAKGWAFLAEVPTMTEVVDNQLKFRRRVVDEQAAFARKMMRAMQPALMRLETTATTTTPTTKTRATKARATKARATKARSTGPRAVKAVGIRAA